MRLLSKAELEALVDGVWTGYYNQSKLPYWLFDKLADTFETAAAEGWGNELGKGAKVDIQLEMALRENVYYFAGHKTAHQLKDMHQLFIAAKSKFDFVQKALAVNEKYNVHWINTEYNVTTRLARAGREWRRIEVSKDIYPKLRFIAVQDANTRESHAALHGIVRPIDDAFWLTYYPPLDWNCRCRVERVETARNTALEGRVMPDVQEQFKERVTESKKIWHESHPYFSGLDTKATKQVDKMVKEKINSKEKK